MCQSPASPQAPPPPNASPTLLPPLSSRFSQAVEFGCQTLKDGQCTFSRKIGKYVHHLKVDSHPIGENSAVTEEFSVGGFKKTTPGAPCPRATRCSRRWSCAPCHPELGRGVGLRGGHWVPEKRGLLTGAWKPWTQSGVGWALASTEGGCHLLGGATCAVCLEDTAP